MTYLDELNVALGRLDVKTQQEIRLLLEEIDGHGAIEPLLRSGQLRIDILVDACVKLNGHLGETQVGVSVQLGENTALASYQRLLREVLGKKKSQVTILNHRLLGSISHEVGAALLAHRPVSNGRKQTADIALPFLEAAGSPVTKQGVLRQAVCRRLDRAINKSTCQRTRLIGIPTSAERVLKEVIGEYMVERLIGSEMPLELRELTWKSWLQLARYTAERPIQPFVAELPVFSRVGAEGYWLSGGRPDIIEFVDGESQPLTRKLRAKAFQVIARRPRNLVHLIELFPEIGKSVFLKIIDFKFQVGDAIEANKTLKVSDVEFRPLSKHQTQVARYLAFGNIAYRKARGLVRTPWDMPVVAYGELWYVFANRDVINHRVECSSDQRREIVELLREQRPLLKARAERDVLGRNVLRSAIRDSRVKQLQVELDS